MFQRLKRLSKCSGGLALSSLRESWRLSRENSGVSLLLRHTKGLKQYYALPRLVNEFSIIAKLTRLRSQQIVRARGGMLGWRSVPLGVQFHLASS